MDLDSDGFPVTSIREIKILSSTLHTNLIKLKEVVVGFKKDSIFLVFEYCEVDLVKIIEKMRKFKFYFDLGDVKSIMIQLLKGVDYMHKNYILHRDLKLSNILLNRKGEVKIADFGLARNFSIL
jgi:serine/threonine protein kinase